jgi:hypothetical protein
MKARLHILILMVLAIAFGAQAITTVERADSAYNAKDFGMALRLYKDAANKQGVSSDLYYNIGNTYYRLGELGNSILYYERALKLDPSNQEAAINLKYVDGKILDKPEDDSTFLMNVHQSIVSHFSPDGWAWVAFVVFLITIGAVALYLFGNSINARKVGFFGAGILVFAMAYTIYIAWETANGAQSHDTAVVIAPSTNLTSTPSTPRTSADKVVPIHEGTRLQIIDSIATPQDPMTSTWYNVKINNTTRAWVSGADIEKI